MLLVTIIVLFYLVSPASSIDGEKLHIAFYPQCGESVPFQVGKQLKKQLSKDVKEFKMRNQPKCEYKEDTNVPQEFPFWSRKPKENYLTISLIKDSSNKIFYIEGNKHGKKLALDLAEHLIQKGFDITSIKGVRCPGFTNLCENYYGGTPVSIRIRFNEKGKDKLAEAIKDSLVTSKRKVMVRIKKEIGSLESGKLMLECYGKKFILEPENIIEETDSYKLIFNLNEEIINKIKKAGCEINEFG